jgi:hypothetical protein
VAWGRSRRSAWGSRARRAADRAAVDPSR